MPLGAHLPTSKGFESALAYAQELNCDCLQIFAKSPRQWKANPIDEDKAKSFRKAWKASGLKPLVVHDSYLINLAAPDDEIRAKSIAAMIDEIERCDLLGANFLVTHCGAHLNKGSEEGETAGVERLAASLQECLHATSKSKVIICLENTAGQGTALGGPFAHIGDAMRQVKSKRLGVCFDTCHAWAAGHDIVNDLDAVLHNFDQKIGLAHLKVIHLNDSKGAFGKHLDRHEHIGHGQIGMEAMGRFVNHPKLKKIPFILETPETETHIAQNLETVRRLQK